MNTGYISMIQALFPNASVIIDRFHLVQLINRAMNKTRIAVMNQLSRSPIDQKKSRRMKRYWRLFLKKETILSYTDLSLLYDISAEYRSGNAAGNA